MTQAHIRYTGMNLDFKTASELALTYARKEITDPSMIAWQDWNLSRMSPMLIGCETAFCWHAYGETRGGKLELFVNGEYDFIFGNSNTLESNDPSTISNLKDARGKEYLCRVNPQPDPLEKDSVTVDEWACNPLVPSQKDLAADVE